MVKKKGKKDSIFLLVGIVAGLFVLFVQNPDFSGEAVRESPVTAKGYLDSADRFGLFYGDKISFEKGKRCMVVGINGERSSVQKIRCIRYEGATVKSKTVSCPKVTQCSLSSCSAQVACGVGWIVDSVKGCSCI